MIVFDSDISIPQLTIKIAGEMYVNEEDVPLIAPNRVVVNNGPSTWKFITASVALSALGLVVVSLNGGFASKSTANVALSEKKMRMSEEGTLIYKELSAGEKSFLFTSFKSNYQREVIEEYDTEFNTLNKNITLRVHQHNVFYPVLINQ